MRFPKKEELVNLFEQPIQLAPDIHSWSPGNHLHRCVVWCCLHTPEKHPSSALSLSPSPSLNSFLPSLLHTPDNNKVLVIRCWLSWYIQSTEHRQQAESEIISHRRLILFKDKESSQAFLSLDTKAGILKHTHIQSNVQK